MARLTPDPRPRTTIRFQPELLRSLKMYCADRGCTMTDVMHVALEQWLADQQSQASTDLRISRLVSAAGQQ